MAEIPFTVEILIKRNTNISLLHFYKVKIHISCIIVNSYKNLNIDKIHSKKNQVRQMVEEEQKTVID